MSDKIREAAFDAWIASIHQKRDEYGWTQLTTREVNQMRAGYFAGSAAFDAPVAAGQEPEIFGLVYRIDGRPVIQLVGDPHITDGMAVYASPPAAEQPDMTHCACGDAYSSASYGAGFIDGSGMCPNCDAAIPARDIDVVAVPRDLLAELDALLSLNANGSLSTPLPYLSRALLEKPAEHIRGLTERLDRAEKDAARFRFIEDDADIGMSRIYGGNWIEAIDAAIAQGGADHE